MQDYFAKWVKLFAVPDQAADTVASLLVDHVFAKFGCCLYFHSDQGTNFESQVMRETCRLFGVKKTHTTSYHPRGDGMVERHNRTIENMLSLWTNSCQDDWDQLLDNVLFAYNTSKQQVYTLFSDVWT